MPISEAAIDDKTHEVANSDRFHYSPLRIFSVALHFPSAKDRRGLLIC